MLLERLTLIPQEEVNILRDKISLERELDLQDSNEVMTELIRHLAFHDFKTIDAEPNRWAMQGILIKAGKENAYKKMQVFLNIRDPNNIYLRVEIIHTPDEQIMPIILVEGNFKAAEVLEMILKLPYFHEEY